ncbi:hypothetical protein BC938DRAFT_474529, partial [Jimgerdemannia flammicorona]
MRNLLSQRYGDDEARDPRLSLYSPARHASASATHLFFISLFANKHSAIRLANSNFDFVPLCPVISTNMDVEFLRRYHRILRRATNPVTTAESRYRLRNTSHNHVEKPRQTFYDDPTVMARYTAIGFGSSDFHVSEARRIEGEWIGYYAYYFPEEQQFQEPILDGKSQLRLRIVDNNDAVDMDTMDDENNNDKNFPSLYLTPRAVTCFEGDGVDVLGVFTVQGKVDDAQDGKVLFVKKYGDEDEWAYEGRFLWGVGMIGCWEGGGIGGPWW